jgi:hypothetical protein
MFHIIILIRIFVLKLLREISLKRATKIKYYSVNNLKYLIFEANIKTLK